MEKPAQEFLYDGFFDQDGRMYYEASKMDSYTESLITENKLLKTVISNLETTLYGVTSGLYDEEV